ncbi:hypothetical protein VTN02DRAFT_3484 [Thermoascus thermophilus]
MADALCGPSNALQNLQKHAQVDRTLQQDRLISRQSPSQGFRSQNPNAGIIDPEFEAFEASRAGPPLSNLQHAGPLVAPGHQFPRMSPAESSDWAADFQRLQLSGPSQIGPPPQFRTEAPLNRAAHEGWQNEFMQQQQQQQRASSHQQLPSHSQGFQPSFRPNYPMEASMMSNFPTYQDTPQTQHQRQTETFDESAFEAAFEQARAEMERQDNIAAEQNATETAAEPLKAESTLPAEYLEPIRIGSDTIPYMDKKDATARGDDSDELAKTAGQLLDSVSHDQSEKFKQSNFLALMRRIRDREVRVEGDEFRETLQPLHPGGKYYPRDRYPVPKFQAEMTGARVTTDDISRFDGVEEFSALSSDFGPPPSADG